MNEEADKAKYTLLTKLRAQWRLTLWSVLMLFIAQPLLIIPVLKWYMLLFPVYSFVALHVVDITISILVIIWEYVVKNITKK